MIVRGRVQLTVLVLVAFGCFYCSLLVYILLFLLNSDDVNSSSFFCSNITRESAVSRVFSVCMFCCDGDGRNRRRRRRQTTRIYNRNIMRGLLLFSSRSSRPDDCDDDHHTWMTLLVLELDGDDDEEEEEMK